MQLLPQFVIPCLQGSNEGGSVSVEHKVDGGVVHASIIQIQTQLIKSLDSRSHRRYAQQAL